MTTAHLDDDSLVRLVTRNDEGNIESTAAVSTYAASLRSLIVGGIDLIEPTETATVPTSMAGAILAPWPNRVIGAWWPDGDRVRRLPVNEPDHGNALHGLLADRVYTIGERTPNAVTMTARIDPTAGYPFELVTKVTYELAASGIYVTHKTHNNGLRRAPFAVGAHPYLRVGNWHVEALRVFSDAATATPLSDSHVPGDPVPVLGTSWDLSGSPLVSDMARHITYTAMRTHNGRHRVVITAPDGSSTTLWSGVEMPWIHLWVPDDFQSDAGPRTALAIEPMSAPPNALQTGEGLTWLEPGGHSLHRWGIEREPAVFSVSPLQERHV